MVQRGYTSEGGFDLRLEAKLKNASLVNARESLGLKPQQVAEKIGISYGSYLNYEAMRNYPSLEVQKKICKFYRRKGVFLVEEDVFPEELRQVKPQKKYVAERTIPRVQLLSLSYIDRQALPTIEPDAETSIEKLQLEEQIGLALSSLTSREAEILRMRFGLVDYEPHTLEQVGERYYLEGERIRQIEGKALRKLRHPSLGKKLRDFVD